MAQQPLEVLQLRVSEMIERIRALQSEKAAMRAEIGEQEKTIHQMKEERRLIRKRIEKLLGTLNGAAPQH